MQSKQHEQPGKNGPTITLTLEPEARTFLAPRPKTVWQLLDYLNLDEDEALVARNGKLLTPDRRIWPDDQIWVRIVGSRG